MARNRKLSDFAVFAVRLFIEATCEVSIIYPGHFRSTLKVSGMQLNDKSIWTRLCMDIQLLKSHFEIKPRVSVLLSIFLNFPYRKNSSYSSYFAYSPSICISCYTQINLLKSRSLLLNAMKAPRLFMCICSATMRKWNDSMQEISSETIFRRYNEPSSDSAISSNNGSFLDLTQ